MKKMRKFVVALVVLPAFFMVIAAPSEARVRNFEHFSIDVPSGWEVDVDDETVTFFAPDESAALTVAIFENEDSTHIMELAQAAYIDGDRGSHIDWTGDPDTFERVSSTDREIIFNVIGHFAHDYYEYPENKEKNAYTEAYPVRMVRTPAGWRFSEFSITY